MAAAIARAHLALYRAKEEILELSRTDPLTGLLNRRALFESSDEMEVLALVIVDIDRFKRVNDRHGHFAGDEVIQTVASTMDKLLGPFGRVGRPGGEEFALLAKRGDFDALTVRLEEFRTQICSWPLVAGGGVFAITVSVGVARRSGRESLADLYRAADRALYLAKASGRNRVVVDSDIAEALPPLDAIGRVAEERRTRRGGG